MGRLPRRRSRTAALRAGVITGTLLLACGARTGLDDDLPGGLGPGADDGGATKDADALADAGADADNPVGCQDGRFTLRRASPAVMFVLDRSQSMRERLASGDTRWTVLTNSLASTLPPVDDTMEIGALIYPIAGSGSNSCVVPGSVDLPPGFGNVDALTKLLEANGPRGSTPTADAIDRAATALLGFRAASRARAMVLATDGEPTCNAALDGRTCSCVDGRCVSHPEGCLDDVRTAERLASYRDQGLPTYVIGIQDEDNTDLVDVLNRLALAGGRPQHDSSRDYYAASSQSELESALRTIRDQVGACTYLTSSVPGNGGTIVVSIDGVPVAEGSDWSWSNRANGEILLTTTTCAAASSADLTVDVRCNLDAGAADARTADAAARDAAVRDE